MNKEISLGIDLGSRFVKIVYGLDAEDYKTFKFDTIFFYKNFCLNKQESNKKNSKRLYLDLDKLKRVLNLNKNIRKIFATGYGRNLVNFKNTHIISEIVAHYLGVIFLISNKKIDLKNDSKLRKNIDKEFFVDKDFLILDIGGQDTKIISVKNGLIDDFIMNDKCASGSGRYFEQMARILDFPIDEMGKYYLNPIQLSNTCAIFGESEVISHIVNGESLENIASGVNFSIFSKIKKDLEKFSQNNIVFVGGMNKNFSIKYFIENNLKNKNVFNLEMNEFNGAFGCFLEALK
jgi:(R)-2-hydroxyacyl-CoA dehydratese activating ATPase